MKNLIINIKIVVSKMTWHKKNWRALFEVIGAIIAAISGYLAG